MSKISVRRNSKGHLAVFIAENTARMLVKPDKIVAWMWADHCDYLTPTCAKPKVLLDLIRYHLSSVKLIKIHDPTPPSYIYVSLSDGDLIWLHMACEN